VRSAQTKRFFPFDTSSVRKISFLKYIQMFL